MLQAPIELPTSPHVIVVGNEKGGSGKTTVAMHIAIALMKAGQRVATIDLDSRQKSLTHYLENRCTWAKRTHTDLELAVHFSVARAEGAKVHENEAAEFADFDKVITAVQHCHFLVIDTPPHDSYLMRLAHSIADTLVSPLNDSFLDLDVLAMVDPVTFAVTEVSHYAEMVREARRLRRSVDGVLTHWVVVRNRLSLLGSCVKPIIHESLSELGLRLGFRVTEGFAERAIYRELFPRGLTALDDLEDVMPCTEPDPLCLTARQEVRALLDSLRLPLDERGRRRAAAGLNGSPHATIRSTLTISWIPEAAQRRVGPGQPTFATAARPAISSADLRTDPCRGGQRSSFFKRSDRVAGLLRGNRRPSQIRSRNECRAMAADTEGPQGRQNLLDLARAYDEMADRAQESLNRA